MTSPFPLTANGLIGIGSLSALAGVTNRALRFYEDKGLITARRNRLNERFYDRAARERVLLVVKLRRAGLPLVQIRELLKLRDAGKPTSELVRRCVQERLTSIEVERTHLEAILAEADALEPPLAAAS